MHNRKRKYQLVLWAMIFLASLPLRAQINDARIWLKASVEKKISRKWSAEFASSIRIDENYSRIHAYFGDLGITHKFNKHLFLGGGIRHSTNRRTSGRFERRERIYLDLTYRYKIQKKYILQGRVRYQRQYTDVWRSEGWDNQSDYLRGKFQLAFDLDKKYRPYLGSEIFYQIKFNKNEFNRVRYEAGIEYEVNKYHSFDLYYLIQREFNEPNPTRSYIIGIGYKLTI